MYHYQLSDLFRQIEWDKVLKTPFVFGLNIAMVIVMTSMIVRPQDLGPLFTIIFGQILAVLIIAYQFKTISKAFERSPVIYDNVPEYAKAPLRKEAKFFSREITKKLKQLGYTANFYVGKYRIGSDGPVVKEVVLSLKTIKFKIHVPALKKDRTSSPIKEDICPELEMACQRLIDIAPIDTANNDVWIEVMRMEFESR